MQTELNHTVKSLFDRETLDELPRDDLHLMTVKYPYSSILQFLYTRKLQSQKDLGYAGSVAKTALYFSNPHWLHHQLRVKSQVETLAEKEREYKQGHITPHEKTQVTIEPAVEQPEAISINQTIESVPDVAEPEMASTILEEEPPIKIEETIDEIINDHPSPETFQPEMPAEMIQVSEPGILEETDLSAKTVSVPVITEVLPENPELPAIAETDHFAETVAEAEISTEIQQVENLPALEQAVSAPEAEIPHLIADIKTAAAESPITNNLAETFEIPLEPLYAVDYFASQGIRLREEDQQDQLGKKLKSFTEWLKSMKKIHPEKSRDLFDAKTEASIKSEADQSNDKAEVLTETMAEVLIKQGLTQKAIEVYEKLSLLDPAKSATFAAKISELKAI